MISLSFNGQRYNVDPAWYAQRDRSVVTLPTGEMLFCTSWCESISPEIPLTLVAVADAGNRRVFDAKAA